MPLVNWKIRLFHTKWPWLSIHGRGTFHGQNVHNARSRAVRVHREPPAVLEQAGEVSVAHTASGCVPPCSRRSRASSSCLRHVPSQVRRGALQGVHPQWQVLLLLLVGRHAGPAAGADHHHHGRGAHGQGAHRLDDFDRVAVCGARRSTWAHTNECASTAGGWWLSDAANGPADDGCQVALLGCK